MTKNSEQKERLDYHGLSKFLDNLKALFAFKTDTPTKLSQLVNDVGYKTTDTVYTHPSYAAKSSGLYKVSVDNAGHVNSATEVTKTDITQLGILSETPSFNDATSIYPTLSAATAAAETSSDAIKSGVNILTTLSNIKKSFSAIIQGLKILGTNVGMIQGIPSDPHEQSPYIAASSKAVHTLNSNLSGFSSSTLEVNSACSVESFLNRGMCFKCGNFVIVKAVCAGVYFYTKTALFTVPAGYRPSQSVMGIIQCRRYHPSNLDKSIGAPVGIGADGSITQSFNNEGSSTIWEGEIFAVYKV